MGFRSRGTRTLAASALGWLVLPFAAVAAPPSVETRSVVELDGDNAVIVALVHPQSLATMVQAEFGPTTAYGLTGTPVPVAAGASPVAVEIPITGYPSAERIHFRVTASNADGNATGDDRNFVAAPGGWTVLGHWTMGDDDAAAGNGVAIPEGHALGDSVAGNDLLVDYPDGAGGIGAFSDQVATLADARGSRLAAALHRDTAGPATASGASYAVTDNFVLEAWCRRQSAVQTRIRNGRNPDSIGYSIYCDDDEAGYHYGSVTQFRFLPPDPGAWLHLALVRDNGNVAFYIDGRAIDVPLPAPDVAPANGFRLTGDTPVDEVRLSTFLPGTFDPSQLLHRAPDLRVEQPAGIELADGGFSSLGTVAVNGTTSLDFLVRNVGDLPLADITTQITGDEAADFTVSGALPATLAAGADAALQITFQPVSAGFREATLQIHSNDPDSPYEINLSGTAEGPEITLETDAGAPVPNPGSFDFGTVDTGWDENATFVIRNTGNMPLGGLAYSLQGVPPGEFELTAPSTAPIAPGQSVELTVRFAPIRAGAQTATLVIASDDFDEAEYVIAFTGNGEPPELDVEEVQRGVSLENHARRDFGSVAPGESADYTIRLHNHGLGTLVGLQATLAGPQFEAFQIVSTLPDRLTPGGRADLTLRFAPNLGGRHDAQLQLQSNDTDESPFVLDLIGEGGVPQLQLESPAGTPLSGGPAAFGDAEIGGAAATRSFTVRNVGGADLELSGTPRVQIGGAQAGEFAVTQQPPATVAHGRIPLPGHGFENKTYAWSEWHYDEVGTEWSFSTYSGVARHGSPWFVNVPPQGEQAAFLQASDYDGTMEQEISVPVAGNYVLRFAAVRRGGGFPPADVAVTLAGFPIGMVTMSQLDIDDNWRWFELPFSIPSVPSARLRFTASCPWADCATAIDAVSIARGNTAAFDVAFAPTARGARNASFSIENDAGGTVQLNLAGTGGGADLVVEQPSGSAIANGTSRDLGTAVVGGTATMQFRLRNTGNFPLQPVASFDGSPAFTLATALPASIASGAEALIDVNFAPGTPGAHAATLHLASNDPDDAPFDILLTGTATGAEIGVSLPGNPLSDGGSVDFGSAAVAASTALTLTLGNTGAAPLTGLAVSFSGDDAAAYSVDAAPPATLAAGTGTTIVVRFTPTRGGAHAAMLHLASNDADENPFDLALSGNGLVPEIAVQHASADIGDGAAIDAGNVAADDETTLAFTVRNDGAAPLTGVTAALSGTDAAQFALVTTPPATLAAGAQATLEVAFQPTGASGPRTALLQIASSDTDENPFDIALTGTVIVPEIALEQPAGTPIATGATRNYGTVESGEQSTLDFTVRNLGQAPLEGLAATLIGGDTAQFVVATSLPGRLAPGESAVFQVQFAPSGNGARSTLLRLASNDADENPIDILLAGTAHELPAADVSIQKTDGAEVVEPNTGNGYVITVRNSSQVTATGLQIVDIMPAAFSNVVWFCNSTPEGKCPQVQGTGDIDQTIAAPLGPNHRISYFIGGDLAGTLGDTLTNTATVTVTDPNVRDPNLANNTATDTTRFDSIQVFGNGFE